VNHAYLFSGPRGCGKTSSARILARSLNCEQGPTPDPCGVCASCVALAPAGPGSIDVIEIDAASHGGVDDARDLRERAFFAPVSGRFKIYIIDEAHMVTREGFNALLKLVEEPPSHLKFVFATTEPEKVIATIRSRTHHYPFRLVPPAVLRELLEQILGAEGIAYEPAVLPVVIRAGAGSVRDSLSVLDQLIAGSDESGLVYAKAVSLLGYTDDRLLDEVVQAFGAGDGAAVFRAIDRVVEAGHDPRRFAADLLDRLRDLIVLAAVPDAVSTGLLDVPADRLDGMRAQADGFGQAELTRSAEIVSAGLVEMRGATSPRLLLELMCAQVLLPGGGTGDTDLLSRVERLERRLESVGAPESAARPRAADPAPPASAPERQAAAERQAVPERQAGPASRPAAASARPQDPPPSRAAAQADSSASAAERPAAPAAVPAGGSSGQVDAATLQDRWQDILEAVKGERRVAWILLTSATVGSLADGVLTIEFNTEGNARGFASSGHDQLLADVLRRMFGASFQVKGAGRPPGGGAASGRGPAGGNGGRNPGSRGDSGWGDAPGGADRTARPEPGASDGGWANGNGTSASHGAAGEASPGGRGSGSGSAGSGSGSPGPRSSGSGSSGPGSPASGSAASGGSGAGGTAGRRGSGGRGSGGSGPGGSGSGDSGSGGRTGGSAGRGPAGRSGAAGGANGPAAAAGGGASAVPARGGSGADEVPIPDWDDSGDWEDPRDQDDLPMSGPGGFSAGNGGPGQRGPAAPPGPPAGLELIEKELGGRIIENPDG
jgi:DNA polymerase-3 subunit gamma/tau